MKTLKEIGVVVKPHGLKGHVVLKLDPAVIAFAPSFESVFVKLHGSDVPFMVEEFASLNQGKVKVKLLGVNTVDQAEQLRGLTVLQVEEMLGTEQQVELVGFALISETGKNLGKVAEVIDQQMQVLLRIERSAGEFYIPLVDELIIQVDEASERLVMKIPEGLMDI